MKIIHQLLEQIVLEELESKLDLSRWNELMRLNSRVMFFILESFWFLFLVLIIIGSICRNYMSGLKQENQLFNGVEEEECMDNNLQTSDHVQKLYNLAMTQVEFSTEEEIQLKLNRFGIFYDNKQFFAKFSKSCIRTDWESTIYEVRFGSLRTQIKIISVDLHSSSLCNNFFNQGGFGEVLKFTVSKEKQYVLKNIMYKRNDLKSMDCAFQELFMAKVFSALEAGPKFLQLFSYDAIVFKNCVQFAMEMCRTEYKSQEIKKEIMNKTFLVLLKNIHHLRICHLDIKKQNIGWSPTFKKFIFLDFTFTRFVEQPLGYKTMIGFIGTYQYSSPQMKKRFQLQDKSFVDLYYNDLHCLNETWRQLATMDKSMIQILKYLVTKQEQPENMREIVENQAVMIYFQLKWNIFEEKSQKFDEIIQKKNILKWTFRKMMQKYDQKKSIKDKSVSSTISKASQILTNFRQLSEIDQTLYQYEIRIEESPLVINFLELADDISKSDKLFKQAWEVELYKENMFFFIDFYCNPEAKDQENQAQRKNLIDKINSQLGNGNEASDFMKFREVICYYLDHFQQIENLEAIEKIITYFVLMQDNLNREKAELIILSILEKKQKYREYSQRIFKYQLSYIATFNPRNTWRGNRYLQNAEKLAQILENRATLNQQLPVIFQTVKTIKIIKISILNRLQWTSIAKIMQLLKPLIHENKQFQNFTRLILQHNLQGIEPLKSEIIQYKDHYLQKCAFMMNVMKNCSRIKTFSLKSLLESQIFTSKFKIREYLYTLLISVPEQKQMRRLICQDYYGICDKDMLHFELQFLEVLEEIKPLQQAETYVLQYLRKLKLSQIQDFQQLQNFHVSIVTVMINFINFKSSSSKKINQESKADLEYMLTPFFQLTSNIAYFQKDLSELVLTEQNFTYVKKNYERTHNHQKFLLNLLMKRYAEALSMLHQLFQSDQKEQDSIPFFHYLCLLQLNSEQNLKKSIRETIVKIGPRMMNRPNYEIFISVPIFMESLLRNYRQKGLVQTSFNLIKSICCYIQSKKINYLQGLFFITVITFIQKCSTQQRQFFIQQNLNHNLKWFEEYPLLTYLSFVAYAFQTNLMHFEFKQKTKRRLLTICAFFSRKLTPGYFKNYKLYLTNQCQLLNKKSSNTTTISIKRKFPSQKNMNDLLHLLANPRKRRKKSSHIFSNSINVNLLENMQENAIKMVKKYYRNSIGEIGNKEM